MKKKQKLMIATCLILFLIILAVTKPSPHTFDDWLTSEYNIECSGNECLLNSIHYKVVSKEIDDYFLFNKIGTELEREDGGFTFVEGIGILGRFIPFTYKPYYE
ncbi:hypothetical protein [Bacillus taeanensis]|uniref:DUF4359 domain-containing protein n=1 Tax=Bacillus taeanensis TaxID=273032 RepID=A0A366XR41_9BACI|nr:hypothetical protein [Bacillus taeanensis]RBW68602.1 hypothetical protein DS031_15690 [Bacillus taeanensis]